jgi:hypothetical protein
MESLGSGLAALGFWLMIAAAVVVGMWFPTRMVRITKENELQKMRLAIESGQTGAFEKLSRGEMRPERKLRVAGSIFLGIGVGTAVLGWFIGQAAPPWAMPLYGCGALVVCLGLGLWLASAVVGGDEK